MLNGLSHSSQKDYGTGQRHYIRFGQTQGLELKELFPVSPEMALSFLAHLYMLPTNIQYDTAKAYMCHLRNLSIMLGFGDAVFSCPRLRLAVKGFRRLRVTTRRARRLPVTVSLLQQFLRILDPHDNVHTVIGAILTIGVHGLFRSGELTVKKRNGQSDNVLRRSSVIWTSDSFSIHLEISKTDPFRQGTDVTVFRDDTATCPWTYLKAAMAVAPEKGSDAPLFQMPNGEAVQYTSLNRAIKTLAVCIGLDSAVFSGHSLRIGGATSLAMLGVPDYVIKELGRWASISYQGYTRPDSAQRKEWAAALAKNARRREGNYFGGLPSEVAYTSSFEQIVASIRSRSQDSLGEAKG